MQGCGPYGSGGCGLNEEQKEALRASIAARRAYRDARDAGKASGVVINLDHPTR